MTDKLIFRRNEPSHDRDFKTPHRNVGITVDGWANCWDENITEYMDVSGIVPERIANMMVAAPDLLEALKAISVDICMVSASSENIRLVHDAIARAEARSTPSDSEGV